MPNYVYLRLFCIGLFLGLLQVTPNARANATVEIETHRIGDLVHVRAYANIDATKDIVWATLTDYERLPQFVPGLLTSKVLARNGNTTTVHQTGEARFLMFTMPIDVTVDSIDLAPTLEVKRVGGTLKQLQGRYDMEPFRLSAGDTSDVTYGIRLSWIGSIEPASSLPALIGEALMRRTIRAQFMGMVREIERRAQERKLAK
jgi:ribosome-associated toxin RatA of RatAB toxin-antitoxin module